MESKTYTPAFLGKVKDAVDQIYELTSGEPHFGGLTVGTSTQFKKVVAELRKREVISREIKDMKPCWIWNPVANAPTSEFYKSVAATLWKNIKKDAQAFLERRDARLKDAAPAAPSRLEDRLADISTQTLWNELKRRGCIIEAGKLVEKKIYS